MSIIDHPPPQHLGASNSVRYDSKKNGDGRDIISITIIITIIIIIAVIIISVIIISVIITAIIILAPDLGAMRTESNLEQPSTEPTLIYL